MLRATISISALILGPVLQSRILGYPGNFRVNLGLDDEGVSLLTRVNHLAAGQVAEMLWRMATGPDAEIKLLWMPVVG